MAITVLNTITAVRCFQAIGQTHRLEMFRELAQAGEDGLTAGLIAEVLDLATSQVSFHLKQLEASGLCFAEREGRFIRYRIAPSAVRALLEFLLADCCQGRKDLCSPALSKIITGC